MEPQVTICCNKNENKKCFCNWIILGLLVAAFTLVLGIIIGAAVSAAILEALAAVIVLAVILFVLIIIQIIMLICCKEKNKRRKDC